MPPALRVLHALHDYLPRHQAGSEIYVAALCAAQRRMGLHPTVVAAEFDPARAHGAITWRAHDGVPVAEVVNTWQVGRFGDTYRDPVMAVTLGHVLDMVQPHVVHVHNLLNLSFDLPAMARTRGDVSVPSRRSSGATPAESSANPSANAPISRTVASVAPSAVSIVCNADACSIRPSNGAASRRKHASVSESAVPRTGTAVASTSWC